MPFVSAHLTAPCTGEPGDTDCFLNPANPEVSGTTFTVRMNANGDLQRTFDWTINKDVSPETLELFVGDQGNPTYTVSVEKDDGTDVGIASGEICVNNGGEFWTRDLTISVDVVNPPDTTVIGSAPVDVSSAPFIDPGETHCYAYSVEFPASLPDTTYRVVSNVSITNHSGNIGNEHTVNEKADVTIPGEPNIIINDKITVVDDNGVGPWVFTDDGRQQYRLPFDCRDGTDYRHTNTATIRETGADDSADVTVICQELTVLKDANTSFERDYDWTIDKASDTTAINLQVNQDPVSVGYTIDLTATPVDFAHAVSGSITVSNPASFAVDTTVTDVINGNIDATVDCSGATSTPAAGDLNCTYSADLDGAIEGTNVATATIPNFDRTDPENPVPIPTSTSFTGTAAVTFGDPSVTHDTCVILSDDNPEGPQGVEVCQDSITQSVYSKDFGPYATPQVTSHTNTACIATDDGAELCDSVTIPITVGDGGVPPGEEPGDGCSLTIGYWKAHANPEFNGFEHFGPQLESLFVDGQTYDLGSEVVTSADEAYAIFIAAQGNDQVAKIKAQLLAVLLNAEADADTTVVDGAIAEAQDFLSNNTEIPKGKQGQDLREQASALINILSSYNEGTLDGSPGHCTS
jgi:hypothetical protein